MDQIILRNVNKKLKGRPILNDINLELKRGGIYAFVGRNASGKTMLLRMIAGLILPDTGSVQVFDQVISEERVFPKNMGLMIEKVGLWNHLTGVENLLLLAKIRKIISKEEVEETLTRVGLDPRDARKYKAYSLGMKQKLVFAQAIMEKPELLLLDEPTNGMDDEAVNTFREIIKEENERGATILMATHQFSDVEGLPDQYYRMSDGVIKPEQAENLR